MPCRAIELDAATNQLNALMAFVRKFWSHERLRPEYRTDFELALEELFVNVIMHGTTAGERTPRVAVRMEARDGTIEAVFEDDARPFNPLTAKAGVVEGSISERPMGGLGLHLIRQVMDHVEYEHVGGRNRVSIRKEC